MTTLHNQITTLKQEIITAFSSVNSPEALENLRILYLGRNGIIAQLMPALKNLTLDQKHVVGPLMNELKQTCQQLFQEKKDYFDTQRLLQELQKEQHFDVTSYTPHQLQGSLHPLTHILRTIEDIFISMGYHIVDGPEVETEYYNFQALNIPENHPARDMVDTLWVDIPGMLLRTHTSSVQIHTLEKDTIPLAIIAPGRVYRHEATDATHDFMFNQIEGLLIDKNISLAHLLGTLKVFFRALFNKKDLNIRVRPSYFPFVEPGIEVDITCPFCTQGCSTCKRSCWIELGGAGLVHPNVLRSSNIDPTIYSGFAFGFGLDRIAMLRYSINDVRLFSSGTLPFLEQF